MSKSSFGVVALSTATYGTLVTLLRGTTLSEPNFQLLIKSISAFHAAGTTVFALTAMIRPWEMPENTTPLRFGPLKTGRLEDTNNPIIAGRQQLANRVTAWEAGYLIYDTCALFLVSYNKNKSKSVQLALKQFLTSSPIFVAHHMALAAALLYLQSYIQSEREKGLWVIMAFICMNASTPLVHLRWWKRKQTRRSNVQLDIALVLIFALARFGPVYWVMRRYGQYHGLGPLDAFKRQRWQCKTGTVLLTGMNFIWWISLLFQIRRSRGQKPS